MRLLILGKNRRSNEMLNGFLSHADEKLNELMMKDVNQKTTFT